MKVSPVGRKPRVRLAVIATARATEIPLSLGFTPLYLSHPVCVCRKPCDRRGGHVPQSLPEGLSAGAADPGPVGHLLFSGPCDVNGGEC